MIQFNFVNRKKSAVYESWTRWNGENFMSCWRKPLYLIHMQFINRKWCWWTLYSTALNDFRYFRSELLKRKHKSLKYCLVFSLFQPPFIISYNFPSSFFPFFFFFLFNTAGVRQECLTYNRYGLYKKWTRFKGPFPPLPA